MIRRSIIRRYKNAADGRLREVVARHQQPVADARTDQQPDHRSLKFRNMPASVSETATRPRSSVRTLIGL
jgi:hypothetical protein